MPKVNVNELDLDNLDEIEELNENFEKIHKGKRFDDGTTASKNSHKKGNKRIEIEEPESESD